MIDGVRAGVGAFVRSNAPEGARIILSGRAGLAAPRLVENGISGNGASSARARRRRRTIATRTATTTIRTTAAPAAITTVLYSSTRYRIWENSMAASRLAASPIDAPRHGAGPGRSPAVRQAQCDPRTNAKARPSNHRRQVVRARSGASQRSPARAWQRYPARDANCQPASRRNQIRYVEVQRADSR